MTSTNAFEAEEDRGRGLEASDYDGPNRPTKQDEIESLRAQLAEVKIQRDAARSEAQCRSWEIVEKQSQLLATQAQLAEVTRERNEFKEAHEFTFEQYQDCGRLLNETCAQLEATQAHAALLADALSRAKQCLENDPVGRNAINNALAFIRYKALSTPTNLDALHEALARECERLEAKWLKDNHRFMTAAYFLAREAEAHRTKKEVK